MIVAAPFFRPFTTPLDVTVATFLLDDLKVIFSSVFFGVAMALILKDFPLETFFAAGKKKGSAVVTVTLASKKTASFKVTVQKAAVKTTKITTTTKSLTLAKGATYKKLASSIVFCFSRTVPHTEQ